jgi:L-ascorbate metabolism protein UlaG (beta-lactamase superfamily)
METTIKWHGHSTFEITVGGQNILLDPWFNGNPKSDVKAADLKKVDLIAVSHGHSDHFGDAMEIMRGTEAKIICTTMISWYMELRGFTKTSGRNISMSQGGTVTEGNMRVSMVDAVHACALFADEWPLLRQYFDDGGPVGYVIRTPDDHSIYFAGDTDIFSDMQFIEKRYHPDVAILPIGGRFTMDCETAIMALDILKPKILIPMHYNTHGLILVDTDKFVGDVKAHCPDVKVKVMQPGEVFVLEQ